MLGQRRCTWPRVPRAPTRSASRRLRQVRAAAAGPFPAAVLTPVAQADRGSWLSATHPVQKKKCMRRLAWTNLCTCLLLAGAGDYSGSLELRIPATGERSTYALAARVGEPLPEGHLQLECQVGCSSWIWPQPCACLLLVPTLRMQRFQPPCMTHAPLPAASGLAGAAGAQPAGAAAGAAHGRAARRRRLPGALRPALCQRRAHGPRGRLLQAFAVAAEGRCDFTSALRAIQVSMPGCFSFSWPRLRLKLHSSRLGRARSWIHD